MTAVLSRDDEFGIRWRPPSPLCHPLAKRTDRSWEVRQAPDRDHIDILPTFIELCGLSAPKIKFGGPNISDLLYTEGKEWPDRALVVESQRVVNPIKWRKSAVMTDRWRLVNGKELFDLKADPKQANDIAAHIPKSSSDCGKNTKSSGAMSRGNTPRQSRSGCGIILFGPLKWGATGNTTSPLRRWPVEAEARGSTMAPTAKRSTTNRSRMRIGDIDEIKDIPAGAEGSHL